MTGNVKRFVNKLDMKNIEITDGLIVDEPFVLVTYTTGFGLIPNQIKTFIDNNKGYFRAVAGSGNKNWGKNYNKATKDISYQYRVPIIAEFEFSGMGSDIEKFKQEVF